MSDFFSMKTLRQLVLYFVVGVYEFGAGWLVFKHIRLPQLDAFGAQSMLIGFTAFLLRKYVVFPEAKTINGSAISVYWIQQCLRDQLTPQKEGRK